MSRAGGVAGGLALVALVTLAPEPSHARDQVVCAGPSVSVIAGFERARANACTVDSTSVTIDILPETQPINRSPWYAFDVDLAAAGPVTITLRYPGFDHRYVPNIRSAGGNWTRLDPALVIEEGETARFTVDLPAGRTTIAGQPFHTRATALAPWRARAEARQVRQVRVGRARSRDPIWAYQTRPRRPAASFVILGRTHPPEEPGAWALDAFSERLFEQDPLAVRFREAVAIVAVPLVNPDGLAAGHWRTGPGLIDLNRDFGPFAEPESRAAHAAIRRARRAAPITAFFDFHATRRDLIFVNPADAPLTNQPLMERWLAGWQAALTASGDNEIIDIERTHRPDEGSSKSWAREAMDLSAITYEVGDDTPRPLVEARARAAAEVLMQVMLDDLDR